MLLFIAYDRHRYVPRVRTDNFRAEPLDGLEVDLFRAFVETLSERKGQRHALR